MNTIALLLAIFRAIPALKEWFDDLVASYIASQIATMKQANKDAIRYALQKKDQRPIEKAIGNPSPGEPSNTDGAEYRDHLPGVE